MKYDQNNAYLQHEQGSPPNAWCRCTDAFGNPISICMQSPTDGLSFGAYNFRICGTYDFIKNREHGLLGPKKLARNGVAIVP